MCICRATGGGAKWWWIGLGERFRALQPCERTGSYALTSTASGESVTRRRQLSNVEMFVRQMQWRDMCKIRKGDRRGIWRCGRASCRLLRRVLAQQQPLEKAYSKERSVSVRTRAISMFGDQLGLRASSMVALRQWERG